MLRAVLRAIVVGMVMIGVVLVADMVIGTLQYATAVVAREGNVTADKSYVEVTTSILLKIAWLGLLVIAGVLLVYAIHIRRR